MDSRIRLGYEIYYPFVSSCSNLPHLRPTKSCTMPGIFIEVMEIITRHLNLTVEASLSHMNITFEESLNELTKGNIDVFSTPVDGSSLLYDMNLYEFSLPIYKSKTKMVVRRAESSMDGIFDFFTIYDNLIWTLIGLIFGVFCIYGICIRIIEYKLKLRSNYGLGNIFWRLTRLNLLQDQQLESKLISGNLSFIIFAFFQCGLFIRMYNNLIKTSTLKTVNPVPFREHQLFEMLKERRFKLISVSEFEWWYKELIAGNQGSPFYDIRKATKNNPIILASDMVEDGYYESRTLQEIDAGGKIAFLQDDSQIAFRAENDYCDFVYMKSPFRSRSLHLLMRRGHPLLSTINTVIEREYIYFVRTYNKYITYRTPSNCQQYTQEAKALTLKSYYVILVLSAVGIFIGFIAFSVELLIYRKQTAL